MAKANAQVIELSDDSDFDLRAAQAPPKRKATESNAGASKSSQSSEKSPRHWHSKPQAPESIPPPPSVAPPKLEKKPRAAAVATATSSLPNIAASPSSSRAFLCTPPVVQDEDRLDVLWGTDMRAAKPAHQTPERMFRNQSRNSHFIAANSASLPAARPHER